jgi:hypothetical protein
LAKKVLLTVKSNGSSATPDLFKSHVGEELAVFLVARNKKGSIMLSLASSPNLSFFASRHSYSLLLGFSCYLFGNWTGCLFNYLSQCFICH